MTLDRTTKKFPSPLRGGIEGGGRSEPAACCLNLYFHHCPTPTPALPTRGRETLGQSKIIPPWR